MTDENPAQQGADVSKDEQIGFHKGALSTLAKERQELAKMLSIVEQLMQMHIKALKELGVDLEAQAQEMAAKMEKEGGDASGNSGKKIDDLI